MGPTAFHGNLDLDELFFQWVLKYVSKYKAAKFFAHMLEAATNESVSWVVGVIIGHVLNEQGTGYEYLKSIELKNGSRHLKEHPNISKLTKFESYWLKRKHMAHFSKSL